MRGVNDMRNRIKNENRDESRKKKTQKRKNQIAFFNKKIEYFGRLVFSKTVEQKKENGKSNEKYMKTRIKRRENSPEFAAGSPEKKEKQKDKCRKKGKNFFIFHSAKTPFISKPI